MPDPTYDRVVSLERAKRCVRCHGLTYGLYRGEQAHRCCVLHDAAYDRPCPGCQVAQAATRRLEREDEERRKRNRWKNKKK